MAIFSRRKNSKAKLDDNETGSLHGAGKSKSAQLLSTFSPSSTGEVLSDILQRRDPQKPLKPALSRASNSDSSVYLTMYAVNNRLRMSSTSLDAEFASANPWIETKQRAPRSPIPKKVSFIITEKEASQDEKRSPSTSPLSTPRKIYSTLLEQLADYTKALLAVDSESNGDDSSSLYSATSSEYSDSSGKVSFRNWIPLIFSRMHRAPGLSQSST